MTQTSSSGTSSSTGHVSKLARSGTLNLAGTIAGGISALVLVLVITNGFDQTVAGMLFAATSLFLIVTALSELGTDAGLAHSIQRELVAGRPERAKAALLVGLLPVLTLSLVLAVAGWVTAPWLAGVLDDSADVSSMTTVLRVLAVILPIATSYDVLLASTRAYGTMRANVLVEKLGRLPAQIILTVIVALFDGSPVWLALTWGLPYLPGLLAVARWYLRLAPGPMTLDSELVKGFWSFTAPRALGRICQVALQRADIVLVAAILGPRSAAIYTAATKSLAVGQLGTQALQQVLQPQLSRLFAAGDLDGAREVFRTATAWLMALAWPVYLSFAVCGSLVMQVFGEGYGPGRDALVILSLTMLIATACGPVDTALLMAGRSRQSLGNSAIALAVNIALLALLVPGMEITGAAIAWAAALIVRNLLPVWQIWRGFGLLAFGRESMWVAGSAVICFAGLPLAVGAIAGISYLSMIPTGLAGAGIYAALLWRERQSLNLGAFKPFLAKRLPSPAALRRTGTVIARSLARTVRRLPLPHRARVLLSRAFLRRLRPVKVPMERLLLGTQDGVPMQRYANAFDDLLWSSTPITDGPHLSLLELALLKPEGPTDAEILDTPYGQHARRVIQLSGRYFWAEDDASIVEVARSFLARAKGSGKPSHSSQNGQVSSRAGQSGPSDPILVAPIRDSDCFSVIDGHHRLALAAHRGEQSAEVTVKRIAVSTPLQEHLDAMSWIGGKRELYQPLDAPELRNRWVTVRQCTDRLEKMRLFLTSRGLNSGTPDKFVNRAPSYLDVACCYGWFVAQMGREGYAAEGIERDPLGRTLGVAVYHLDPGQIQTGDAVDFLQETIADERRFDVVSCFSLLHHFVLGRGIVGPEELVRLLSSVTRGVLFLDTGQDHEAWFAKSLAGWDAEHVKEFLLEHGEFAEVIDLGPDSDAVPPYEQNYGRHLFACVR